MKMKTQLRFLLTSFVDSIKGSNFVNTLKMYKL